jgi:hypothetical protein
MSKHAGRERRRNPLRETNRRAAASHLQNEVTMRTRTALFLAIACLPLFGQAPPPRTARGPSGIFAERAEIQVKQAIDQLATDKKNYDRDLEVLTHLRIADVALTDPMQPHNAIEKAFEEVGKAKSAVSDFATKDGIIKVAQQLEDARRSPTGADFGRLRSGLRTDALGPAIRVAARNGAKLSEETLAWIRVQELISGHLRQLSEITSASLRATQQ